MSQRTCRTADILLAVPAPGEWARGPLVQLGLLCGALDTVLLGRMILQLLARSLPWHPSSDSKPFPNHSWSVILLHVDPKAQDLSLVCQISAKELGFLCGLLSVTIGRASAVLLNPHTLAYVTHEDICRCFAGDTLLAIRAPSGTSLEVPIPEGLNGQKKYQIHLKSVSGPIEVLLVNKEAWSSPPVAVPVPPPEDLLQSPPAVSTPPPLPKPTLAQPQDTSRPSSPQLTTPTPVPVPVPDITEAQGVPGPATEITVSGGPGPDSKDGGELGSLPSVLAALDTRPLQSSALLDSSSSSSSSSSSGPNPSTSFEPIKADPTGVLELPKELSEIFDPTRECMNSELLEELMSSEVFAPLLRLSPPPGDHDYIYNLDESEGVCDLFDVPVLNL
uniref:E2F transcription factor 4 n=1 Tax=Neovison vison TaxID=452646 RepID=A0A8C7ASK5_NEOVI